MQDRGCKTKKSNCDNCKLRLSTKPNFDDAVYAFINLHNSIKKEKFEEWLDYKNKIEKENVIYIIEIILYWMEGVIEALLNNEICQHLEKVELNRQPYEKGDNAP